MLSRNHKLANNLEDLSKNLLVYQKFVSLSKNDRPTFSYQYLFNFQNSKDVLSKNHKLAKNLEDLSKIC